MDPTPVAPPIHLSADTLSAALAQGQVVLHPVTGYYFEPPLFSDPDQRPCGCAITVAGVGAGLLVCEPRRVYFPDDPLSRFPDEHAWKLREAIQARWPTVADRWLAAEPDLTKYAPAPAPTQRLGVLLEAAWELGNWPITRIIASLEAIGA